MIRGLLLVLTLSGCTAVFRAVPPTGDEVTIFVPGYKGSFLSLDSAPAKHAWIDPTDVLCAGHDTLALPFEGERPVPSFGPLHAAGPMTRLTVLPLIAEEDVYESWMEYGTRELPGFVPFSYDWRQDIRVSAAQLAALIDHLSSDRARPLRINLVAHSMGGLVALYYLRYGADPAARQVSWEGARHVQRVTFVATPFRGSPAILKDFVLGATTGLNTALLSKEALFTFAAAFQLMPATDDFFFDAADRPVPLAASDPATWYAKSWGVFADPALQGDPAYRLQLTRMLTDHLELARALRDVDVPPPPTLQALVIIGHGRSTVSGARLTDGRLDTKHPLTADGDEAVTVSSATPPRPLEYRRLDVTGAVHSELLNDKTVRAAITRFVRLGP